MFYGDTISDMARLTIEIPDELHELFMRKALLEKPKQNMTDRIVAFIAHEVGKPVPKKIDLRKLTREQRARFDQGLDPFEEPKRANPRRPRS